MAIRNESHYLKIGGTEFVIPNLRGWDKKKFTETFKDVAGIDIENAWHRIMLAIKDLDAKEKAAKKGALSSIDGNDKSDEVGDDKTGADSDKGK